MYTMRKNFLVLSLVKIFCLLALFGEEPLIFEEDLSFYSGQVNVLTGEYIESGNDLSLNGPFPLLLTRVYTEVKEEGKGETLEWQFNHPGIFIPKETPEVLLNDGVKIHYEVDADHLLSSLKVMNSLETTVFHEVSLMRPEKGLLILKADDGREVHYHFSTLDPSRASENILIDEVIYPDNRFIKYQYRKHPLERKYLISKIETPGGGYIETEYYDNKYNNVGGELIVIDNPLTDFRMGRVKQQKAPTGPGGTSQIFQTFFYEQDRTIVKDALGNKKIYTFTEDKLLQSIEWFEPRPLGDLCIKKITLFWPEKESLPFKIKGFAMENGKGDAYFSKTFLYDGEGNCIQESIYGNLSGLHEKPLLMDENGLPFEDNEKSVNTYRYFSQGNLIPSRIVEKIDDKGLITRYFYSGNNTLSSLILCNRERNFIRQFFAYDEDGLLIESILDDGQGDNKEDFSGVSERKITRYKRRKTMPGKGLIEEEVETAIDCENGREVFIKKTMSTYDNFGNLIEQVSSNENGQLLLCKEWEYDENSRILKSKEKESMKLFEYSLDGKIQEELTYQNEGILRKNFFYDHANRLVLIHDEKEGRVKRESFTYNVLGQKTASIDEYGNETFYEYDGLGRLKSISYPIVLTELGSLMRPREEFTYDLFGNKVCIKDANGYEIKTKYNIRGKPTEIHYPDGSSEKMTYSLDGSLSCKVGRNKIQEEYSYDQLARVIKKEVIAENGDILSQSNYSYSTFRLKEREEQGKDSHYVYDPSGLLQSIFISGPKGKKRIDYVYDEKKHVLKTNEWEGDEFITSTITKKDDRGNIIEEWIEGAQGEILRKKKFPDTELKKPLIISENCICHSGGYREILIVHIDSKGNIVESTLDGMKRLIQKSKKNSLGEVLEKRTFSYDLCGNKIRENHENFIQGDKRDSFTVLYRLGPMGRIEEIKEESTHETVRKTIYLYSPSGLLETVIKPDGVSLSTFYNDWGEIKRIKSSDNTIDYSLEYDTRGNITQAFDLVHGIATLREYDEEGLLTKEVLGNGLSLASTFDGKGRRKKFTLPDQSSLFYEYDSIHLKAVKRLNLYGDVLYEHQYNAYDQYGNVVEEILPFHLGIRSTCYEKNGLAISITTPYFIDEYLSLDEMTGVPKKRRFKDKEKNEEGSYSYDHQGNLIFDPFSETEYTYDALGNRIFENDNSYHYIHGNELTKAHGCSYSFDANGNLIKKIDPDGNVLQFSYDALDRLIQVSKNKILISEYIYDPFHRRIEKKVFDGMKSASFKFIWDGQKEIGSMSDEKNIHELRILGKGKYNEIGASLALEIQGKLFVPIHDLTGSIRSLVSFSEGKVVENIRYNAFGEELSSSKERISPWRFEGKRLDEETGFLFFGRRYYDPHIGRWISLDPLGYQDGPNRFLFVENNPILNKDPFGLFSIGDFFSYIWEALVGINTVKNQVRDTLQSIAGFDKHIQGEITTLLEASIGKGLLGLAGYYQEKAEEGIYGQGESSKNVRITLINGISNLRAYFCESMELILKTHGGSNIHYLFRPTEGWCWDLIKGFMIKLGFVSPYAEKLASSWKKLIQEMGGVNGGGLITHYCHSLGGTDTMQAAYLLTEEERKMIRVFSFGSATMIPSDIGFESVTNFVSMRDGVSLFDPVALLGSLFNDESNIVFVGTLFGAPFIDHMLISESYKEILRKLGIMYMKLSSQ